MSEILDIPPTNWGPRNSFFQRLRNLKATSTVYIFGKKHDIHNRTSALEATTTRSTSQNVTNFDSKLDRSFTNPRKFCILLHCHRFALGDQQSKLNETFSKQWTVNCANNPPFRRRKVGLYPLQKLGQKAFKFVWFIEEFET